MNVTGVVVTAEGAGSRADAPAASRRHRKAALGIVVISTTLVLAACSGATRSAGTTPPRNSNARAATTTSKADAGQGRRATTTAPTTTTTDQPPWAPVASTGGHVAVDTRTITGPAGGTVTVFRFRAGQVHYDLHVGSTDPPTGAAVVGPNAGPAIGAQEAPLVLAAFNGGFKVNAGAGGFELDGQTLEPLVPGDASLVIDENGSARIGVWGQTVPVPGEQVASVRQNLAPLVVDGRPSPQVGDLAAWGSTLNNGTNVPRSALGQDAAGNLLYAAGMSVLPTDLAGALVTAGAVNAMELDINPEWVQLAYAAGPGGALTAGIPGQNRPAGQYEAGWSRDFVVVLAGRPA